MLPRGAVPVAANLASAAVTTYAFLAIAARVLGPEGYAPLSVLWSAVFLVVPALWGPLEQETSRRIAHRRARGDGAAPVVRAAALASVVLGAPTVAVVAAGAPWSSDLLFSGEVGVAVALAVAIAAFGANHLRRAALSAVGAFWAYGACISIDSGSRLIAAAGLAVAGVESPVAFASAVALAPLVPLVFVAKRGAAVEAGPCQATRELIVSTGPLIGGQLAAQALINGGPIAVALLASSGEDVVAGQFLAALLVARIPLFFFQAIQGSFLPGLASSRALGDHAGFARATVRLSAALLVLTVTSVVVSATLGPAAIRLAFGPEFALGGGDLAMLAAGAGLFMVATVAAHASIALEGRGAVARGWVAGLLAAAATLASADDLLWRVELAMVVGVSVALVVHALAAVTRWRTWVAG